MALTIEPTGEVWNWFLDEKRQAAGQRRHPQRAGEAQGPLPSTFYTAAFGNGSVTITVNGKPAPTPTTPSPMGFSVHRHGKLHEVAEGKRPSSQ